MEKRQRINDDVQKSQDLKWRQASLKYWSNSVPIPLMITNILWQQTRPSANRRLFLCCSYLRSWSGPNPRRPNDWLQAGGCFLAVQSVHQVFLDRSGFYIYLMVVPHICKHPPPAMFPPDLCSSFSQKENFSQVNSAKFSSQQQIPFLWPIVRFRDHRNHRSPTFVLLTKFHEETKHIVKVEMFRRWA